MQAGKSRLSRRAMLGAMTVGGATAGAAAITALNRGIGGALVPQDGSWWSRGRIALASASSVEWAASVGSDFVIGLPGDGGSYKLVDVQPLPSPGERPDDVSRQRAFLAVFEGKGNKAVGDRIYPVKHASGNLDIYFSPADPAAPGRLQAVFN